MHKHWKKIEQWNCLSLKYPREEHLSLRFRRISCCKEWLYTVTPSEGFHQLHTHTHGLFFHLNEGRGNFQSTGLCIDCKLNSICWKAATHLWEPKGHWVAVIFLSLPPTTPNILARLLHLDTGFPTEHLVTKIVENLDRVQRRATKMIKWLKGPIYKELRNV